MMKYEDGLNDGQQVALFISYAKIEKYVREYMGSHLRVVAQDEGDNFTVPTRKFAEDLAKVIASRLHEEQQS